MYEENLKMTEEMLGFIRRSPSPYHTVASIREELEKYGYAGLAEGEEWRLEPGGKYYVSRAESSILAFRLPKNAPRGFMLGAAHSDSPTYRLKQKETLENDSYVRFHTEGYGGMISPTFLDRPLSVAGRVLVRTEGGIESRLVTVDRDLALIPNVAIHMNRDINSGYRYNPAVDLIPLIGTGESKGKWERLLLDSVKRDGEEADPEILASDLCLYLREEGRIWGVDNEFVSSPRLDDLQCVYALMRGLCECEDGDSVPVLAVFDNEEIGSSTACGADSSFLSDTLARICEGTGTDLRRLVASSMMVSADNGHAIHPNHPEYADSSVCPKMNCGIAVKRTASHRYATDAVSQALFLRICKEANVPVQYYANRSDLPGGSTLGSISDTHIGVPTVDVGLAQLAMHSAYETAGAKDCYYLYEAMKKFYSCTLNAKGNETEIRFAEKKN